MPRSSLKGLGNASGFWIWSWLLTWNVWVAARQGKLFHFDINDGYRLKHDVDIAVGLVNPFDWLNVLVLLRTYDYKGPFNLDFKPPRTTSWPPATTATRRPARSRSTW